MIPICPYCGNPAHPATGADIYPHREDLHQRKFWRCEPCKAYVGCHITTGEPFGTLANARLRKLRNALHRVFDAHWLGFKYGERRKIARTRAYQVLAAHMGIPFEDCHIGMFDEIQCQRAMNLCNIRELFKDV